MNRTRHTVLAGGLLFVIASCNPSGDPPTPPAGIGGGPSAGSAGSTAVAGTSGSTGSSLGGKPSGGGNGGMGGSGAGQAGGGGSSAASTGGASGAGGVAGTNLGGSGGSLSGGAGPAGAFGGEGGSGGAPPLSKVCGDGIRDPKSEQCDDGNSDDDDACTSKCVLNDEPVVVAAPPNGGPTPAGRSVAASRHPVAADDQLDAVVFATADTYSLGIAFFTPSGVRRPAFLGISNPLTDAEDSRPAVALATDHSATIVWSDNEADGDGRGIAVLRVDADAGPVGSPSHANAITVGSQSDPDVLWTGQDFVISWTDSSNLTSGPDTKLRHFGPDLAPRSDEITVGGTNDAEGMSSLANFGNGFAIAWRTATDGGETTTVLIAESSWTFGPYPPSAPDNRPAITQLDQTHLLLAFAHAAGGDVDGADTLATAIIDTTSSNVPPSSDLPLVNLILATGAPYGLSQPSLATVGGSAFLAFRAASAPGQDGDEIWVRSLDWNPATATLDLTSIEYPLALFPGDQRAPGLAASPLGPNGAIGAVWDDYGKEFPEAAAVEPGFTVVPVPWISGSLIGIGGMQG